MQNSSVLYYIFLKKAVRASDIARDLQLTKEDANYRVSHFCKEYKWLTRTKWVDNLDMWFGTIKIKTFFGKAGVSLKDGEYHYIYESEYPKMGGRLLFFYQITDKGLNYLKFKGFDMTQTFEGMLKSQGG